MTPRIAIAVPVAAVGVVAPTGMTLLPEAALRRLARFVLESELGAQILVVQ